jgi:hypothetical protein
MDSTLATGCKPVQLRKILISNVTRLVIGIALAAVLLEPTFAQYPGGNSGSGSGYGSFGKNLGIAASGAAGTSVGIQYSTYQHSSAVTGCVQQSGDGWTLVDNLDRQAIAVTLQQLSAALSHRSMSDLKEIWPKLGPQKNTFKKVFDGTKSLSREFHTLRLSISSSADRATAIGSYEGNVVDGRGVETPSSGNFYVRLGKKNGRWYIDDASF